MEEEGEVENHSFNNYQQMATVVNAKFPNHSVAKFPGRWVINFGGATGGEGGEVKERVREGERESDRAL